MEENQGKEGPEGTTTANKKGKADPDDIFGQIGEDNVTGVHEILRKNQDVVNSYDDHGMTPLQHAAYKGNKELCQILLDYGAEVNGGKHNNAYTALHFAALSGNAQLCQMLLQYGANPSATNSVKRTAAQMAAFVGNHHCVAAINSFVDIRDVEYFSNARGIEKTPLLDPVAVRPLHQLITQVNFHPVRVALTVKKSPVLLKCIPEAAKTLEEMCVREMKKGSESSEIVAFKLHLLGFLLKTIEKETNGEANRIDLLIEILLKSNKPERGIGDMMDLLLRQAVREFKFRETTVMQQLVANLAHTQMYEEPGAWSIICTVVNGQKGFRDNEPCVSCGEERGAKKCSRCHYDAYCDKECQKIHWFLHKKYCKKKAAEYEKRKKETADAPAVSKDES